MSKFLILILLFLTFFQCTPVKKFRLLEFANGEQKWVPLDKIYEMIKVSKVNQFMDITDTVNLKKGKVPPMDEIPKTLRHQKIVKNICEKISQKNLNDTIINLSNYFTRYYESETGVQAAHYLFNEIKKIYQSLPEERRRLFSVNYYYHNWKQPSIIASMKGQSMNSTVANSIVILGAHLDSILRGNATGRAPGADDNASGVSTILETLRVIAQSNYVFDRSIEFMFYAAEEVGLRGSADIAFNYKNLNKNVHAVINYDMIGYNFENKNTIGIIMDANFTNLELNEFLKKVVSEYTYLKYKDFYCIHPCSDYASWHRGGYRASEPFESAEYKEANRYMHTENDLIHHLDMKRSEEFVKIGVGFAVELSKL